jgi:hypothetical protein
MRMLPAVFLCVAACTPPPPPTAPVKTAHTVSAIVLVNGCSSLGPVNAKLAESAMTQLVEGCSSFGGGSVRFTATLLPGGAIQFEPHGDAKESIPICVLSHPLKHGVRLKSACSLDVQLEETAMALSPPAAPAPH